MLGNAASKPLGAEVIYLMALCVHERAERSQTPEQWKNAAEWWQRFLDASALAASCRSRHGSRTPAPSSLVASSSPGNEYEP